MRVLQAPLLIQSSISESWGCWAVLITVVILVWIVQAFRTLRVRIVRKYWVRIQKPELNQQLVERVSGLMKDLLVDYPRLRDVWKPSPGSVCEALRSAIAKAEMSGRIPTKVEFLKILERVPEETVKDLAQDLQSAFESLTLDIRPIEPLKIWASQDFWGAERLNRITKDNRDPKDWPERRRLVHLRDEGRCVRCGITVPLEKCHIHHLVRRSQGGTHEFTNLVTVCRDCHTCMEEHQHMRAIGLYRISSSGLIHSFPCRSCRGGKLVKGSLPYLIRMLDARACQKCRPWVKHNKKMNCWTPGVCSKVLGSLRKLTTEELLGPVACCVVDPPHWLSPLAVSVEGFGWLISAGLPLALFIWSYFIPSTASRRSNAKKYLVDGIEANHPNIPSLVSVATGKQSASIDSSSAEPVGTIHKAKPNVPPPETQSIPDRQRQSTRADTAISKHVTDWRSVDSKLRHDVVARIQKEFEIQMDPDKYSLSQLTDFELRHNTSNRIQREFSVQIDPDMYTLSQLTDFELRHSTSNRIQREFSIQIDPDMYTLSQLTDFELRHSVSNRILRRFGIWLDPDKYSLSQLIDLELKQGSSDRPAR